ncbi:MAG TPA: penicillin-binding transpeptidase domain-containing protein [Solirubrobacteraceae bacterium]|nr:penicillin-binding transpeptidase domain-containing protein [Solirubrobacteraceae bacterium]
MNQPIARLFALVVVLFAVLIAFTSRWTIFEAASLRANVLNKRPLLEQREINRGSILAADGTVLARSAPSPHSPGAEAFYERVYPTREEFAHAVGYWNIDFGNTGLEQYRNAALTGQTGTNLQRILDQLQGRTRTGDTLYTTLNSRAQLVAMNALAGREGAIVALDPRTGGVLVMASSPSFDPNSIRAPGGYAALARPGGGERLVNRATQFGYAPGSTFKVVTATAAIDSRAYTPESTVSGKDRVRISGVPLSNDNHESFGELTLTQALAKSVNTVWAQVAEHLGKSTIARYMSRFGFDSKPPLDYPATEMSSSGEYEGSRLISPTSEAVDVGRMGIGQDKLAVTPLQMAEVAAAVANRGRLMTPRLSDRVVDRDGRTVERFGAHLQTVVMKPSTATAVDAMMQAVVNEGTGTSAQIPGVAVAGKTGTAETQIGTAINNVWFIAFAPAGAPRVAIAVTLKGVPGFGGAFAAPVARAVMESLLHG